MSGQNSAPADKNVLRDISEAHEDQPGDLGKTRTEKSDRNEPDQPPR